MMELGFYMNEMGLFQVSLRKAGSIIILCIFLSSIAWVGSLSLTFFDNDEPDSNENDDPSEGEWVYCERDLHESLQHHCS